MDMTEGENLVLNSNPKTNSNFALSIWSQVGSSRLLWLLAALAAGCVVLYGVAASSSLYLSLEPICSAAMVAREDANLEAGAGVQQQEHLSVAGGNNSEQDSSLVAAWTTYKQQLWRRRQAWPRWEPKPGVLYKGKLVPTHIIDRLKVKKERESLANRYLFPVYPCPRLMRIGVWADGGKWICHINSTYRSIPPVVYSVGSKLKTEFENDLFSLFQVRTYTFDPTLTVNETQRMSLRKHIRFYNIGLSGSDDMLEDSKDLPFLSEGAKFMYIENVMAMLNHSFVDIFKIDCEGCEYSVVMRLEKTQNRNKPLFGQVLMEVQRIDNVQRAELLFGRMEALGYLTYQSEPNYYDPTCVEVAYIHESLVRMKAHS